MQGRQQSTRQHAHREATGATRLLLKTSRTFRDNVKKTNRTARKLARLTKAIEVILVPLIKANALDELKFLLKKMDADQVRELGRSRIMGLCRLFFAHDEPTAASQVLLTYLARDDPYDLLYFIEPLCELIRRNCSGLEEIELRIGAKRNDVIGWLANAYLPADESDLKNFLDFVIEPLRLVERGNGNLMQIRLSESQRHKFTTTIASRLEQRKPFSLVRLGDGEAYPYAPPPAEGIDPGIFNEDSKNFERRTWGGSTTGRIGRGIQGVLSRGHCQGRRDRHSIRLPHNTESHSPLHAIWQSQIPKGVYANPPRLGERDSARRDFVH